MAFAPIDAAQFQELWQSATDEAYAAPFIQHGADACFEVWGQTFEQFERVSEAIDVSTQSMFIMPWSGQTNLSAKGAQRATVMLTFTRTGASKMGLPLVVDTNVVILEQTDDHGVNGAVPVTTGRRFTLLEPLVFNPGESGPIAVEAIAERSGYGYNNPLPGSLRGVEQLGVNLSNIEAVYVYVPGAESLTTPNFPDTPVPQHLNQYMVFTQGPNAGSTKRISGYGPPDVAANVGGVFYLESMAAATGSGGAGTFMRGEKVIITQSAPNAYAEGKFVKRSSLGPTSVFTFVLTTGALPANPTNLSCTMTGVTSGATVTLNSILIDPTLIDTPVDPALNQFGSGWAIVSWADPNTGFGLTVTNAESPSGGRAGMLDELGAEREIPRSPNEDDDNYAERVHQLADTVSPNAVLRAANRIMAPYGLSACLRECGQERLVGFFLDRDAFDYDFSLRPNLGRHVLLDYEQFRAYFYVCVPQLPWGEFGFAYDLGPWNAYDTVGPDYLAFYDGFPWQAAKFYLSIYNAIAAVVAGGVGFTLMYDTPGCQP